MTVGDLMALLSMYDKSMTVVVAGDAEGNSFSPLSDTSHEQLTAINTWELEIDTEGGHYLVLWPTR